MPRGVYVPGGYMPGGGAAYLAVVSTQGGLRRGVCREGAVSARGVSVWGVGCVSQHALRQTIPLWTEFLKHTCENITLPQLRCGR